MKKFVLLFALLGVVSFSVNAQSCSHAAKAKAGTAKVAEDGAASAEVAAKMAALDENVEQRVCSTSGSVSYVRKNVCAASGKVSYSKVEYCTKSNKFVNVSPSAAGAGETTAKNVVNMTGSTKAKAGCSKSAAAKAGCCSKSAAKASCSKSAKSAKVGEAAPSKLVKNEK